MAVPKPEIGLVVRYGYLWRDQARQGRDDAAKDRPCVIVHMRQNDRGATEVFVCPVTRTRPHDLDSATALPAATKLRLGLDPENSWVISSECNRFIWPGPDIRRSPSGDFAYGHLPPRLTRAIIDQVRKMAKVITRSS